MLTNQMEVYFAMLFSYCQSMVTRKQVPVIWNVGGEIRWLPASIETPELGMINKDDDDDDDTTTINNNGSFWR